MQVGRRQTAVLVLLLAALGYACRDSPSLVKAGPPFAAAESTPTGKALVYVFWPRKEQGRWSSLWVASCKTVSQEIPPGGYTTLAVEPGPNCLAVAVHSELLRSEVTVSEEMGSLEWTAEPGQTYFIRLGKERSFLRDTLVPRLVSPATAGREIEECRQSVPLTPDELAAASPAQP